MISIAPAEEEPATISSRPTLAEAPTISSDAIELAPPPASLKPIAEAPPASFPPNEAATRASARPTDSFGPAPNEKAFFDSAPGPAVPSVEPPPSRKLRPRSRARSVFAKVLFVTMFAGVAALLGLALKTKFDSGPRPSLPSALTR
jgi:hypothetical protein